MGGLWHGFGEGGSAASPAWARWTKMLRDGLFSSEIRQNYFLIRKE
jgi:hypothetical protein